MYFFIKILFQQLKMFVKVKRNKSGCQLYTAEELGANLLQW